jgi:hypothetical protein
MTPTRTSPLVGKTVSSVLFDVFVEKALPWIDPKEVDEIREQHRDSEEDLYVRDGLVYRRVVADLVISTDDGNVYYVSTCGCCGGIGGELGVAAAVL